MGEGQGEGINSDGRGDFPSPAGAGEGGAIAPGEGCRESTNSYGQGKVRVPPSLAVGYWLLAIGCSMFPGSWKAPNTLAVQSPSGRPKIAHGETVGTRSKTGRVPAGRQKTPPNTETIALNPGHQPVRPVCGCAPSAPCRLQARQSFQHGLKKTRHDGSHAVAGCKGCDSGATAQ